MNKTRMGKRAASLLLSLVMMLSLLPTAAYAAMGNADETQGAIVSENGTGVSDDSNSSGNTDDLQVGDSKDSGNTGDQQVGGSSGSGTADDPADAEGGADPTDSVNGNDSADPQDDGDAVLPTATTVVSTSEELVAAIAAASDGDTITLGEGEFTTYGNTSPKKSLTFEGVGTNTVWTIGDLNQDAKGEGNGDCSFDGCDTITFKNMTLKVDNKNYRGFIRINHTVVENCTLEGRTAYWGYETAKFVNATFNAPEGDYALWDYSTKAMTFEGCTFNISGKGVNVYVEAGNAGEATRTVEVNNCTVESTKESKAFLNIKNSTQSYDVTLSGTNTVNGLTANGTTGSALYQVETTEVTETTGNPVTVKQENTAGEFETIYEVKKTEKAYVAEVGSNKYETLQAAIDAAAQNATVTLLADTRENVTIETYGLTLDLSGHTLNGGTVAGKPALTVKNRVTVKDSSAAQTGTIMREDTAENSGDGSHYVIDIQGQNTFLKFEGGTVKNNSGNKKGNGASLVRVGDDSVKAWPQLTITGGTFTQDNFIVIKVDRGTFYLTGGTLNSQNDYAVENWKSATIKGGTVNGAVAAWTYSGGANSDLTISGGTVNGDVLSVNYGSAEGKVAKVSITGGTVNGALDTRSYDPSTNELTSIDDATKATIKVTGGTFKEDPSKYVVENSGVTPNGDGTFGVAKAYLATVGDTSYYTMDEAFKAQTASGEPIVLLRDYTTGSAFSSGSIDRTVDLAGHTWTCTGTDANSAAFEINYSDASLTVKNGKVVSSQLVGLIPSAMGGTIKYDNSSLVFDGVVMTTTARSGIETNGNNTNDTVTLRNSTLNVPNGFGIYFPSSGTLTIDNSVINAKTMGVQVCSGSLNISGAGTAITVSGDGIDKTINDGAIEDGAAISIVNRIGYKGLSNIEVKGGTFTAKDGNAAVKAYNWKDLTPSDFTQNDKVSVSGGTFSSAVDESLCADGYIPTKNTDGTFGVKVGKYVAEIGSQGYESLTEAVAAAEDGQTVTLLADAAEDVVISKSITLDLGGKTLTNTNAGKATISVTGGTVTVKNGNVMGGTGYYNIEVTKEGSNANLTLTDVTATAGNTGSSMIDNYGTLTITSGTYTGGLDTVKNEPSAKLNITGGTFTLTKGNSDGFTGVVFNYGELTISGGEFVQSDKNAPYGQAQVIHTDKSGSAAPSTVITGGTFKNLCTRSPAWTVREMNAAAGATKASGGTFNKNILEAYCAAGFIPTKNADGTYGVKEGHYVAAVGSKKYETLADAIRLATKGKTITLLADVEQNTQLAINKSITLDLNGKTIRNTVDIWGDKANAILSITNGAKVTITGNGTIDAKENDCYTINVVKGDLTIENGTFYGNVSVVQVEEGTLSVKGGTFDLHQKWEGSSKYLFNCIDSEFTSGNAKVAISGGTFVGFDPNVSPEQKVDGKTPSFAAPGVGITKNENGSFTAAAGMTAQILDKDGNSVKAYNTLADAVAAAQDGQTVRLLADVAESSIEVNANITIDLNKMTVTGSFVTYGEVTIQNGTIDVPDGKTNYAYGKLTLADVDITGKAASSSLLSVNYNGSVTIDKDSTIVADSEQGHSPAVFIKGQDDIGKTYAPELNIYGTVQSAKTPAIQGNGTDRGVSHVNVFEGAVVKSEKLAIYLPQPCEVNITGGLVEGYCGIGIKSGTLNISGGTVRGVANDNVIGDEYSQTNGISYDGSAIMIDSYIGYAGQVQINISGNAVVESKYSTAIREIGNDKSQTNLVGLDITGGTVLGAKDTDAVLVRDVTAKDVNISGGEFSSIVKKEYCAPGFTPVTTANSEGRYGVEIGMFTVMVTSRTTGSNSPVANVTGGGSNITYAQGTTVTASAISGYKFVGWFVNEYPGTAYSTDLTCEVKPTADWTMIAVYEPVSGGKFWLNVTASEFTVNGGAVQDSYLYEQFAIGTSVTVEFTGTENFLYWVNASNKVVSTDKSYTFIMGSETTLKAVYGKARQNQATVVFISHSDQIISSKAYTTNDTIQFPVPPIKMGCTFTGWSMTEAEIRAAMANNSGIIQVRARYTEPSIACKVTVVYPEGVGNEVVNAVVGKAINVTAKDIEGKTFSYWTDNDGNVLGYTKTLKLAPSGDMTVKAVYDEAAEVKPVISMTAMDASEGNGYYVISFTATRAVPEGYELVKQGILYSIDSRCVGDAGKDYLKLTADGTVPEGVKESVGNNNDLNGVTRFNGKVKTAETILYGRGYMILKNSAGEVLYVYADTILSGSYNSLNK
ncbi:beta strand repeat-containing protein [Dysosmobacter sp.]|uniref:beta strand repeat-containing protein n=1 Tax=Dysosmobacter sp. TaxID=2591382 RepID=UPI003A93C48A